MFYLVSKRTELGMEVAKRQAVDAVYGTGKKAYFNPVISGQVSKVTSKTFEKPELIRAWFKKNREDFCAGKSETWDPWLNGEDSKETTEGQNGIYRFWFMDVEEFEELDIKQRKKIFGSSVCIEC
jgi:hypothetical protein